MHRRSFRAGLVTVAATPLAVEAQAGKVWRIGLVHVGLDHVPPALHGLREGLKELGYEESKNLRWDFRNLPDESAAQGTAREFRPREVGRDCGVRESNRPCRKGSNVGSPHPVSPRAHRSSR